MAPGELELDIDNGCPKCKANTLTLEINVEETSTGVVEVTCTTCGHKWGAVYTFKKQEEEENGKS